MDITNITFDELAIGDGIEVSRLVTARDVELFAVVSGDHNPLHLDPEYAATTQFRMYWSWHVDWCFRERSDWT